jgi:hypothetical protein
VREEEHPLAFDKFLYNIISKDLFRTLTLPLQNTFCGFVVEFGLVFKYSFRAFFPLGTNKHAGIFIYNFNG